MDLERDREARVITPERVPLTLPLAGLGERAIATLVDALILILTGMALLVLYTAFGRSDLEAEVRDASQGFFVFLVVVFVVGVVGYDVFFDLAFAGRTPGKALTRLRVVDQGGRTPELGTSLLRNLMRLVDLLPAGYGVGAVTLFFTGTRRLGDLVAGTVVVSERARGARAYDEVKKTAGDVTGVAAPAWSDADVAAAVDVVVRTAGLDRGPADVPAKRVLARVAAVDVAAEGLPARTLLAIGVMARASGDEGLAARLRRLVTAEDALREALMGFDAGSASADVVDAAARTASSELMMATRRGVPARHLESLSLALLDLERRRRLPKGPALKRLVAFFAHDVPAAVWDERQNIQRAAVLFVTASLMGFGISFADADVARAMVGDDLAELVEKGADWTNEIERDQSYGATSVGVIVNNVGVGARVFAGGVLGGVGSLVVLVWNGLSLGAVFGYATSLGTQETLLRFIVAHGPVELSMIVVAAAAGLCLGRAILSPGRRSRTRALREEGKKGLLLLAYATTGFLVVGTVEGFVSPGALFPTWLNASIGVGLWLLFAGWVYGARPTRKR